MGTSIWDQNTSAASNTSIQGVNIAENCAPSNINDAIRSLTAQAKGAVTAVTASGTDTYTATLAPAPDALTDGMDIRVRFTNANTSTTPTLNINSLGAKTITKNGGDALVAGDIPAGHDGILRYVLASTEWQLMNPVGVTGPSSSTTGNVPKFSDTTGKVLADGYGVGASANDLVQLDADANFPAGFPVPVGASRNLEVVRASATTLTVTADEIVCKAAKGGAARVIGILSVTLNIANTGANGMDTGSASASADLSLYAISGNGKSDAVLACLGSTSNGEIYSGTNMPTGYTASALIGTYKMNASAQFDTLFQLDRRVFIVETSAGSSLQQGTYTSLSISSIVPSNAKTVSGSQQVTSGATSQSSVGAVASVAGDANGTGAQRAEATDIISGATISSISSEAPIIDMPLITAQTIYHKIVGEGSASTASQSIWISAYTF